MSKRFAKTDKRGARGYNAAAAKARAHAREVRDLEAELHRRGYTDEDIRRAIKEMTSKPKSEPKDERNDAVVVCSPYPATDPVRHRLMLVEIQSIVGRCARCDRQIYISLAGQEMGTSGEFHSLSYVCESCTAIDSPDAKVIEGPGTREQLESVFGAKRTDEVIAQVTNMKVRDWYAKMRRENGPNE